MKKLRLFHFITIAGILLLSACGNNESTNTETSTETSITEENVLVDTLGNEVTIPANPQRIIASYLEDYLIALDTLPVAQWSVNESSVQDYLQEQLNGIPTIDFSLPYEEVLSFEPDLLLIGSSGTVESGNYDEYAKIAPTYVVKNGDDVNWRDQLQDIATVLDKEEQAAEVITNYEALAEETKQTLSEQIPDKTVAILWVINNSIFMVTDSRSSGTVLYGDLGLGKPALVEEISATATADWNAVTLEKLAELDSDALFLINSDTSAPLFEEDIWKNLKAVQDEQVFEFDRTSSWLYNGPIANTQIIEDVRNALLSE
jgi:iron complex transport system substrate-binding protein